MSTLVPLDHRYQNREEVPLDRRPDPGEAAMFRALAPLGDEWQLTHWHRWTVVVPFVDVDTQEAQDLIRAAMERAVARSDPQAYAPASPGPSPANAVTIDGQVVPELDALSGTADFPIATESTLAQTTLTYTSSADKAELSVVVTFTPEPGEPADAFRRTELGSTRERSSPAGSATSIGHIAAIDTGSAVVTLVLDEPGGLVSDRPSARLQSVVARMAPVT